MPSKKKNKKQKQSHKKSVSPARRGQSGARKTTKAAKNRPVGPAEPAKRNSEIPKFDLAEEIMAEQRKITAKKRMAPTIKNQAASHEMQAEPVSYTIQQPTLTLPEQQIIADIVAGDIEKLCKGGINQGQR